MTPPPTPSPSASPSGGDNFLITIPTAAQNDAQADDKVKCKFCSFQSDNLIELNRHEEEGHKDAEELPNNGMLMLPVSGANREITILRHPTTQQQMTLLRPGLTSTLLPTPKTITLPVASSQPGNRGGAFLPAQPNQPPLTVQANMSSVIPSASVQPSSGLWRCPYCEANAITAPLLKQHLKVRLYRLDVLFTIA